ncbi:amino acid adenylation domain-containing protein [Variovorax sp. UC122_21]|uniref:amino acid adenylation domain-containing protein n=1 Tax=Variovorax sp. UC122_21 TaxID=3374554 RepID=UPI003757B53C
MSESKDLSARRAKLSPAQLDMLQRRLKRDASAAAVAAPSRDAIVRGSDDGPAPSSFAQQGQWFLWQLDPGNTAYHVGGGLGFVGPLDVDALRQAMHALALRHDTLRTAFRTGADGLPEQVVEAVSAIEIPFVDLSGLDPAAREARHREAALAISRTPFDLAAGPLLRGTLLKMGHDDHHLLLMMHHIGSDAWSVELILDELARLYALRRGGSQASLETEPEIRYVDFARWQRAWLEGGEGERQLAYWRQRLGASQPVLELATDRPRAASANYRAAQHVLEVPPALAQSLKRVAREHGATPFMVLLAAFHALLFRHSGQQEIRVGVPVAGRHRPETQGVVGAFINTVVMDARLSERTRLAELLVQVRDSSLEAQAHQDLPFERLVQALSPDRGQAGAQLFQVMFNHLGEGDRPPRGWPELLVRRIDLGERAAPFELNLETFEHADGGIHAVFRYAADLFEPATMARLAGHYRRVLEAMATDPAQALGALPLLADAELAQLAAWGVDPNGHPGYEPVHEAFARHARRTPDATALLFADEALGYGELDARANRLAHRLIALGVGVESRVGIAVERSVEMMVGILAILKAGAAYVPLDPEYPADRLAYIVADSGIALLLTQRRLHHLVPVADALPVLELDTLDTSTESAVDPGVKLHGANLAYVIYTSGSTGKPKGAAIRHDALHNCMAWMQQTYGLTDDDTVLHKAPFGFDVSVWEMFWPLTQGVRLVVANPGDHRDPERLVELIRRHQVTTLNFVPSMLQAFLAHEGIEATTRLRYIICGGEAMPAATQGEALRRLSGATLQNLYGPTETTIHVTHWTCRDDGRSQVPIGRPVSATGAHVLDAGLNPVPQGVAGELYLSGASLARGYLNRAGLTSERFIAAEGGGRLYRTGDLVRWSAQGELEYLGRLDHQVKVRGFRIELGEVEAQLLGQPEVREAVVVAHDGAAGASLAGYVSLHAGASLDTGELRDRLGAVLPDYMVPAALMVLQGLPLNANGKVDRKALPAPQYTNASRYEAPVGAAEQTLAGIWAEVLGVERVGRQDNFFELGGHSLLALRLLERVRREDWTMQVRTLFQQPQLGAFAQALLQEQGRREVVVPANGIPAGSEVLEPGMLSLIELDEAQIARIVAAVPGGASNIQDIYPLAPLQEGMLFHHLLQASGDAYVTPLALSFETREQLERFVDSLDQVIQRHDILRTAVLWEGLKEPVQVVQRSAALRLQWPRIDDAQADVAQWLEACVDPSSYRIDVREAPMIRALAAHDARHADGERWLLQLPSHHLVLDHTTLELLVQEIALVQQGLHAQLPEPVPFRRYVAQSRLGVSQGEHEAFFRRMLADVDEPTAPFNVLDVQGDGQRVDEARERLEPELARGVRREAQRHGVSAATLFHLAWALVLARTTGKDDVVFGTVLFGRMQGGEGAQRALGMFINTLPLRVRLGARDVLSCVRQTHESLTQLLHHEHAGLSLAQRCSGLPGGTPLFSALLNYRYSPEENEGEETFAWAGMRVLGGRERSNYPFCLSVDDLGEGFALVAQTVQGVDAQRVCGFMRAAVEGVVRALAEQRQQPVCELELLPEAELAQLDAWGVNARDEGHARPVHEVFEAHAARHPEAVALVFGEQEIGYGELNARANRLAHRLMALGVGPEARVGIALERGVEMVVAILGVVKAGGAYVPLDPEYPVDRLAYMVGDSGIGLLLTQGAVARRVPVEGNGEQGRVRVLVLDEEGTAQSIASEPTHDPGVVLHGENIAYVIYTSGSTGKPKGAANRHGSLFNRLAWMQQAYRLDATDTVLQKTPFGFDVSVWEFFWPLMTGARLVVAAPGDHREPARLVELIRRHGVSTLHFVPSMLQAFLAGAGVEGCTSLRHIVCSGEALSAEAQNQVFARLPQARLHNLYGPTEAAIDVTHWTCRDDGRSQVPIGQPISGTRTHVLDAALNPAPAGVAGELYLGGLNLARGYLNRPGLSAERFVAAEGGERLYRTGDLVRWNAEGELEYLGRIDHQVKIRGLRIELGEIEAQLLAQPEVREAVVVADEGPAGMRLVGYVSAHAGHEIDSAAVRERLAATLPDYMVPGVLIVLQTLPLNANGKVDRKALPSPQSANAPRYEAPVGETEQALAGIWAEVLGLPRVGRHDNFFELGGHSLLAVQVAARVQGALHMDLAVKDIFLHPVVMDMAALVASQRDARPAAQALSEIDSLLDSMEAV